MRIGVAIELKRFKQGRNPENKEQYADYLVPNDTRRLYNLRYDVLREPMCVRSYMPGKFLGIRSYGLGDFSRLG